MVGMIRRKRRLRSSSGRLVRSSPSMLQHIEHIKVRPLAAEQQLVEVGAAVRLQAADLAIEHRGVGADSVRDFLCDLRPLSEGVPVAGD